MKKIISLFLAALFIAATFIAAIPVGAVNYTGDMEVSLTNAAGMQNDEITVQLNIDSTSGFFAFIFFIYYDSETFILRDCTFNDELASLGEFVDTNNNVTADRMKGDAWKVTEPRFNDFNINIQDKEFKMIFFDSKDAFNDLTFTGTVATLKFQIMGIAEDGDYEIGIMPSPGNVINCEDKDSDIFVKWTNASVRVGSEKPPKETLPQKDENDTVDPSEITEAPETKSREQMESEALDDTGTEDTTKKAADTTEKTTKEPAETFKGEDGSVYVKNEDGETELYVPEETEEDTKGDEDTAETVSADGKGDISPAPETEDTETDVAGDAVQDETNKINIFGMKVPLVFFIAAILLILIAIAAVLFVIISKTKKSDKELDDQ